MLYVGLDIHKNHITRCVLDANGKVKEQWQVADADPLTQRLTATDDRLRRRQHLTGEPDETQTFTKSNTKRFCRDRK